MQSLKSRGLHNCEQYVSFDLTRDRYSCFLISVGAECR